MNSTYDKMAELLFEAGVQRLQRHRQGMAKAAGREYGKTGAEPSEKKQKRFAGIEAQLKHKEGKVQHPLSFVHSMAQSWAKQQSPSTRRAKSAERGEQHIVGNLLKHVASGKVPSHSFVDALHAAMESKPKHMAKAERELN